MAEPSPDEEDAKGALLQLSGSHQHTPTGTLPSTLWRKNKKLSY